MITVAVDRDTDDHGRWHVMTAWDATAAHRGDRHGFRSTAGRSTA